MIWFCRQFVVKSFFRVATDLSEHAKSLIMKGFSGGQGQNRTADTKIFSLLLYRLSYLPTVEGVEAKLLSVQRPLCKLRLIVLESRDTSI